MKKTLLLLPLLLTASCSAVDATAPVRDAKAEARLARLIGDRVAGATRNCIGRLDAEQQHIIDERTIIFGRGGGNRLYRSDISPSCPGLDYSSTLIRRSTSTDICSGEIFIVHDAGSGFDRGSCSFGEFTEYSTPRR